MGGRGGKTKDEREIVVREGEEVTCVFFPRYFLLFGPEEFKGRPHCSWCCTGWSCGCGIDRVSDWSFPQPKTELIRSSVLANGLSCAHDIMRKYLL